AIRRATELDREDPAAAAVAWAEADERVTDAAVWVPFVNLTSADLVAPRVGNYLRNPQWGVLVEQLWVE
ncbi:MAG: ABC transporter substrate-binding protein, partial [Aldersonia sp.]|nr:ABC transporter substrate-binding protein [Aldersonia sp.]